jgi:hypothetical protein
VARSELELADIIREYGAAFDAARHGRVTGAERRVLRDLVRCRTAALGGHIESCLGCGHETIAYNSCRNRHCPKCQAAARAKWFEDREREILPIEYFHVVFTVPREIAAIALQNKRIVYEILLRASATTLLRLGRDPKRLGAQMGVLSVLHTWGQKLDHHPHVHCVVTGGGLALDRSRWVPCRPGFLFPVRVMGHLFRGRFLAELKAAFARDELRFHGRIAELADAGAFHRYLKPLYETDWVVYSKPPFGGPACVIKYLARYTHRVAISNRRLLAASDGKVSFAFKDYADDGKRKVMTLDAVEFLRRFLLHILPKRFQRIRHYGLLANRQRKQLLDVCRSRLGIDSVAPVCEDTAANNSIASAPVSTAAISKPKCCSRCGSPTLVRREIPSTQPRAVQLRPVAYQDTS